MSVLCDKTIRTYARNGMIVPFDPALVQPASYELTLSAGLMYVARTPAPNANIEYDVKNRCFIQGRSLAIDLERVYNQYWGEFPSAGKTEKLYIIKPNVLYIASSAETLSIPPNLMSRFEGKSSLGRAGLLVHITAGYIDPGFNGQLTFEIYNVAPWNIILGPGDKIGQLSFHTMDEKPQLKYGEAGNHYQNQIGPTLPR
jgi:dCTP deaminase